MTRHLEATVRSLSISIMMYHQIGPFPKLNRTMNLHRSTYCRVERFRAQMGWLARHGYTVLSMDQVLACVTGHRTTPPRAVALTFDDGYENFAEHAWPILRSHRFPATVYLISGLIGRPSSWFAADGRDTPPLMSGARIRQLASEGCTFGAHTVSHAKLAEHDTARIRSEVRDCKTQIEDVLGQRINHFCYPYGSHDLRCLDAVAAAGYASATTCVRASASLGDDPLALPRKAISYGDNLLGVAWKLHMKNHAKEAKVRRPRQIDRCEQIDAAATVQADSNACNM
ncbi:polysaccharide deacetylase family protein [Rhodocyclaceae bacterium SMB388]